MKTLKTFELFDYQKTGAAWLASKSYALLADKQRLGKTVQSIEAANLALQSGARILVVCRAVAKEQWAREFQHWSKKQFCTDIRSFEMATRYAISTHFYDLIIVDEAHYLKNAQAQRTQRILGKNGLIHKTKRMWLLTGTPVPNNASELWTILFTFGCTKLSYESFVTKFCNTLTTGYGLQILGTKTDQVTINELKSLLGQVMLRRTETDVSIQLPSVFKSTQYVTEGPVDLNEAFPSEIKEIGLEGLKQALTEELGLFNKLVGQTASTELIETLKAQAQSISTLRRFTAMQKVEPVVEMITEELESRAFEKCVIFCIHVAAVEGLKRRLSKFNPVSVIGGTINASFEVEQFQSNPTVKIFIGNISAAGTSIELSAANHIFFLEESWTPGDNHQAAMRCGGINQKKPIFVKTVLLPNSVDIKVHENISRKTSEQEKIYDKN